MKVYGLQVLQVQTVSIKISQSSPAPNTAGLPAQDTLAERTFHALATHAVTATRLLLADTRVTGAEEHIAIDLANTATVRVCTTSWTLQASEDEIETVSG